MSKRVGFLVLSPPRIFLALATVSLALAGSVGPSSAATDRPEAVSAIKLVEQRIIEIPDSRLLALSPDGGAIAVARPDGSDATELCVHEVATLAERVCADLGDLESGLWHEMVVWSPDSQWLAFAELWPQYFAGGGLWLMDASTGALTDLLDDSALALYPTFTPDSTALTFERTLPEAWEFESIDIATVPITGGEAVRLGDSERPYPGVEHWGMAWSEDGSGLYVTLVASADRDASVLDPDSGIWVFGADVGRVDLGPERHGPDHGSVPRHPARPGPGRRQLGQCRLAPDLSRHGSARLAALGPALPYRYA